MMRRWLPLFLCACGGSLSAFVDDPSAGDTGLPVAGDDDDGGDDDDDDGDDAPTDTATTEPIADCADDVFPGPGTTSGESNDSTGSCGGGTAPDVMLSFTAPYAATWKFVLSGALLDTVLYVLDGCDGSELACDDVDGDETVGVALAKDQEVIVVVDGAGASAGAYDITATEAPDTEGACANGLDDDFDGKIDCEDRDCDDKPACAPEADCTDGDDNDSDGLVDCFDDDCEGEIECRSPCADVELTGSLPLTVNGNTSSLTNDYDPSCQSNSNANDFVASFIAPSAGTYTIDTNGSALDTVLYVLDSCQGTEVLCDDDGGTGLQSQVSGVLREGQRVILVVDGYGTNAGAVTLSIRR